MDTQPPPPAGDLPHRHREVAESFGAAAERYDRARPGYPKALVDAVVAAIPGPEVLDVGIGTGISARPFRDAGCSVLGVEVDPRMAEAARQRGFEVDVAAFEDWDAGGRTFDAVVAGQTWHWIDPVAGAVKAAQVLRPGGRLAVFWNVGDPAPEIAAAFADLYRSIDARAADGIRQAGAFAEPERWRFDWEPTIAKAATSRTPAGPRGRPGARSGPSPARPGVRRWPTRAHGRRRRRGCR